MAAEVAAPFASGLKDVKMISTGNGNVGASKLTAEVMDIVLHVPEMVEKMTGVQLKVVCCCLPLFDVRNLNLNFFFYFSANED